MTAVAASMTWAENESTYAHVPLHTEATAVPSPLLTFREDVLGHVDFGAFDGTTGDPNAKAWFLSHLSESFTCERDLGGICSGDSYAQRIESFVRALGNGEELGASSPKPRQPETFDTEDMNNLALYVGDVFRTLELDRGTGDYCTAVPEPRSDDTYQAALDQILGAGLTDIDDILLAIWHLKGVMGIWNVRAQPGLDGEIVGKVRNEMVFFEQPNIGVEGDDPTVSKDGYDWRGVILPSGVRGYIATDRNSIVSALVPRICLTERNGHVKITRYIGGGD